MDLKISDVANLLQVSESTIKRWIKEEKIPVYQINREFRFNRDEVENWMLNSHDQLEALPFKEKTQDTGNQRFSLYRAIHNADVLQNVEGESKVEVIEKVVEKIAEKKIFDKDILIELLLEREKMQSTGLGSGIAIPHTRDIFSDAKFDLVTVVFTERPIPYQSLDGNPVQTLFFLFAKNDKSHLHLLAKIAHLASDPEARKFLETKPNKNQLLEFLLTWENQLSKLI